MSFLYLRCLIYSLPYIFNYTTPWVAIINPNKTKNNKYGNITKNQENCLYPDLHIEFNTNVQNATNINSIKKTKEVFFTGHV